MDNNRCPEERVVYRGIHVDTEERKMQFVNSLQIFNTGFTSTTTDLDVAIIFRGVNTTCCMANINLPIGCRAFSIREHSLSQDENEILLAPGYIRQVSVDGDGNTYNCIYSDTNENYVINTLYPSIIEPSLCNRCIFLRRIPEQAVKYCSSCLITKNYCQNCFEEEHTGVNSNHINYTKLLVYQATTDGPLVEYSPIRGLVGLKKSYRKSRVPKTKRKSTTKKLKTKK